MTEYSVDEVIKFIKTLKNIKDLKRILSAAKSRIAELRRASVRWNPQLIGEVMAKLNYNHMLLIKYLAQKGDWVSKDDVMKDLKFGEMLVASTVGSLNRMARDMGMKDIIERQQKIMKLGVQYIKYKLDDEWIKYIISHY